jgi:hypothetical protein
MDYSFVCDAPVFAVLDNPRYSILDSSVLCTSIGLGSIEHPYFVVDLGICSTRG